MREMGGRRTIRAYDYVGEPYERVRDAIRQGALTIFQTATKRAEERSESLVSMLKMPVAEGEPRGDIAITVRGINEETTSAGPLSRVTDVDLEWHAAESLSLFLAMKAELRIHPLSESETQVELVGEYQPPPHVLPTALEAQVGHRIAEASVHCFVRAVVERLHADLA